MSEFIHVHLLDKKPVGANLGEHIPQHVTLLHWFESERPVEDITRSTSKAIGALSEVVVQATIEDMFGPNNDIPVMRLSKDPNIVEIHGSLLQAMRQLGATFNEQWTGVSRWNPHVTHKPDNRLYPGDEVYVTDIDLITRPHKNGDRTILHRFDLSP